MNSVFSNLFKKLKSIKHIEIILAVLFALIIMLVYFSSVSSDNNQNYSSNQDQSTSATTYATQMENKLASILSRIDGVGKVDVMLMLENASGEADDTVPNISSVIVVAEGAENVWVKLEIVKAIEALLNLSTKNIEVLVGGAS